MQPTSGRSQYLKPHLTQGSETKDPQNRPRTDQYKINTSRLARSFSPPNLACRLQFLQGFPTVRRTFPNEDLYENPREIPGEISQSGSQIHLFGAMMVNRSGPSGRETAIPHDPAGTWDRNPLGGAV